MHTCAAHMSSSRPEPQVCIISETDPPAQYSIQIHSASRVRQLPCTQQGSRSNGAQLLERGWQAAAHGAWAWCMAQLPSLPPPQLVKLPSRHKHYHLRGEPTFLSSHST